MTRAFALPLLALLAAAPAALAQSADPAAPEAPDYQYTPPLAEETAPEADGSLEDSADLIGRGMDMFFRNLLNDMAPEIEGISRDLGGAFATLGPAISDLSVLVDDIANYQAPQRLENGDIIIRRKPGAPPPPEIGQNLRDLGRQTPDDTAPQTVPIDPDQPQIEL